MKKLFGLFIALLLTISIAATASASTIYPATQIGHDVSFPNSSTPSTGTFGIVGVNRGRAFTYNSNFSSEYQWASSYRVSPSVFINLNAPIGTTASQGLTGPAGSCSRRDKACQAYNYGYNAAQAAYNHFSPTVSTASFWWLDIETSNSWSSNTSLNRDTIDGATAFFAGGVAPNGSTVIGKGKPVGIYSTPSMWGTITGNYQNALLPTWVATTETSSTGAASHCLQNDFTSGQTFLVQYNDGSGFDADYACP